MMVALRISVVRRVEGLYVLGNGSALGNEVPPGPGDGAGDACGDGDGCGVCEANCVANESSTQKQTATRIIEFIFTSKDALTELSVESGVILLQACARVQWFRVSTMSGWRPDRKPGSRVGRQGMELKIEKCKMKIAN
jgi:hypothetical protein